MICECEWAVRDGDDRVSASSVLGDYIVSPPSMDMHMFGATVAPVDGVTFQQPSGRLHGVRFAIEAGLPTYQHLDGPGLETDWITTVGVQYAFE